MLIHPDFDPVAIHLGPLAVRWYGLMYLLGFLAGSWAARWRIRTQPWLKWTVEEADNFLTYVVLGVILGGPAWGMCCSTSRTIIWRIPSTSSPYGRAACPFTADFWG